MIIKILGTIAAIFVILLSIFVILKINSEENKDNSISDVDKFVGKWRLINTDTDNSDDEMPDTTEEPNKYVNYETYAFLSNGTYYHVLDDDNTSGVWEINNSMLDLTVDDPFGDLTVLYKFVFSDDNHSITLSLVEESEILLELEKITV